MLKQIILFGLVVASCAGMMCGGPGGPIFVTTPLDQAHAVLIISRLAAGEQALVTARITTRLGNLVHLSGGQEVLVNDQALLGPNFRGEYTRTIAAADEYVITVKEPTRGVEETVVTPPDGFQITSPEEGQSVSLSGFTVEWSGADPDLDVEITIRQTLFGEETEELFGPFTDTGSRGLTSADLSEFRQGADLTIMVTKMLELGAINGFRTARLTTEASRTVSAVPGP